MNNKKLSSTGRLALSVEGSFPTATHGCPRRVPPLQFSFHGAANIQNGETDLQKDKSVGFVVEAPDYPEHIANQKGPESPVAFELPLRGHQPRGQHGNRHRRPLN